MSLDKFPYNLESEAALIQLIKTDYPDDRIKPGFIRFDELYFSPTRLEPGRTYVEMFNMYTGIKQYFVYRRLDLSMVSEINQKRNIELKGKATGPAVLAAINLATGMKLTAKDIVVPDGLVSSETSFRFNLITQPGCFVYYGSNYVQINVVNDGEGRQTEDGSFRITEDGSYRALEMG